MEVFITESISGTSVNAVACPVIVISWIILDLMHIFILILAKVQEIHGAVAKMKLEGVSLQLTTVLITAFLFPFVWVLGVFFS